MVLFELGLNLVLVEMHHVDRRLVLVLFGVLGILHDLLALLVARGK